MQGLIYFIFYTIRTPVFLGAAAKPLVSFVSLSLSEGEFLSFNHRHPLWCIAMMSRTKIVSASAFNKRSGLF
jgi:hypothetical protein